MDINIVAYKTIKKKIIEVRYVTKECWDDNVEINDIDLYKYITVDDNNVDFMHVDEGKIKLERCGDVTKDDFSII